tara:strand:- start:14918 stop:16645 length:1728 start_codon:yes stop_codon:yes gene_type:complete
MSIDQLAQEFLPRLVKVDSSCGCTLTNASFQGLTPAQFEAMSGTEIELARVIANSAEAKVLGVQERGLTMLLKSSVKDVKPQMNTMKFEEQSIILPYIQRRQRQIINANYYDIVSAEVTPNRGTSGTAQNYAQAIDITVNMGTSNFRTNLTNIERYFLKGLTLIVLTWDDSESRTAKTVQYEIIAAENANSGGDQRAKVTIAPLGNVAFPTDGAGMELVPNFGIVQITSNNISDWEYWCENQPDDVNLGMIVNWFQTSRDSRCVNGIYKDTLAKMLAGEMNQWDKTFEFNAIAEQNRRATMLSEDNWMRSVFYNDYLAPEQKPETYNQLPTVEDPESPGCVLEYKANALGLFTMLSENGRVIDLNGAAINLDDIFEQLYLLKRNRMVDGDQIQVIDSMTDRGTANIVFEVMSKYFEARYGFETSRFAKLNQKVEFNGIVSFEFDLYDIPDASVQWAVFREPFFDDHVDAFNSAAAGGTSGGAKDFKSRARNLWFIDWSDVSIGIGESNSVTRKSPSPEVEDLYKCRMKSNITEYNLRSQKWTVFMDRPARHLIIHNFNLSCPVVTAGSGCSVPNV